MMAPTSTTHVNGGMAREAIPEDWLELCTALVDPDEERILLDTEGALALLVRFISATAHRPQPWLALGASLAALGALMGHRFRTETNLRSNLYVLCVAPSGAGKERARGAIKEAFIAAGLEQYLGGERIASGAGLMAALKRHPAALFQIDEFGKFVSAICDRRAPKHLTEIWDRLTELATSAGGTWLGTEYANQEERPREKIVQPCACLHACSTQETFWPALQHGAKFDGSLARFLLFEARSYPDARFDVPSDVPEELIAALQAIAPQKEVIPGSPMLDTPRVVPMTPAAREALLDLGHNITERLRRGRETRAMLARWVEHTLKVALIAAVSANPAEPVIDDRHFEWASGLVQKVVEDLLYESEERISDNEEERKKKQVVEKIREAGKAGISLRDLTRKTQFLDLRTRSAILNDLVHAGIIDQQIVTHAGAGRPGYRFFVNNVS